MSSVESEKYIAQLKELAASVTRLPRTPPIGLSENQREEVRDLVAILIFELGVKLRRQVDC